MLTCMLKSYIFDASDSDPSQSVNLSPLKVLEEVILKTTNIEQPDDWVGEVLSTITSHHFRRVAFKSEQHFSARNLKRIGNPDTGAWNGLQSMFLEWQPREAKKLEVVFMAPRSRSTNQADLGEFLQRCRVYAGIDVRIEEKVQVGEECMNKPTIDPVEIVHPKRHDRREIVLSRIL